MNEINICTNGVQHFWLPTGNKGMPSYSCPVCGQLVYWSPATLKWVKPGTSGHKKIPGNVTPPKEQS